MLLLGGRTRARTWDPMIKSHLLYQLSYAPGTWPRKAFARGRRLAKRFGDVQQTIEVFPALSRGRKREKPPDSGGFSSDIRGLTDRAATAGRNPDRRRGPYDPGRRRGPDRRPSCHARSRDGASRR